MNQQKLLFKSRLRNIGFEFRQSNFFLLELYLFLNKTPFYFERAQHD